LDHAGLTPGKPSLSLRLLHQHMVEQQHEALTRLIGQPLRRLGPGGRSLHKRLQKRKRGRVVHTSPILTDKPGRKAQPG
jgi:hypothetical protein